MSTIRSIAAGTALVFAVGAFSTGAGAMSESVLPGTGIHIGDVNPELTLDEMNCISSDLRATNSIPCSSKGTNWGKPKKRKK